MEKKLEFTGEVSCHENRAVWKIAKFWSFPPDGSSLQSPQFSLFKRSWHLFLCIGKKIEIGIYQVTKKLSDFQVRFGITFKNSEFGKCGILTCGGRGGSFLMNYSEVNSWVPEGDLDLFFVIENLSADDSSKTLSLKTSDISLRKLQKDFEFLLEGNISDIIVKAKDKEFRCHRCILAARSPVFLAMVTHDTKEKASGVIQIDDIDPSIVSDFIKYLYTGNTEHLTSKNALDLYTVGDKYQVTELKNACLENVLENITVDNFCEVLALSLLHSEQKLTKASINFFTDKKNALEIIKTSKWQEFMSKNPIACNELHIKLLEGKSS